MELTQDKFDKIKDKALDLMRKRSVRCNCSYGTSEDFHLPTCAWRLNANGCWDEAEQVIKKEEYDE